MRRYAVIGALVVIASVAAAAPTASRVNRLVRAEKLFWLMSSPRATAALDREWKALDTQLDADAGRHPRAYIAILTNLHAPAAARCQAAEMLGRNHASVAVAPLVAATASPDIEVAKSAMIGLDFYFPNRLTASQLKFVRGRLLSQVEAAAKSPAVRLTLELAAFSSVLLRRDSDAATETGLAAITRRYGIENKGGFIAARALGRSKSPTAKALLAKLLDEIEARSKKLRAIAAGSDED